MTVLLECDNMTKRFGGITAVDGCSIDVERGSITGLIGPNGSGKTTLFNLITGMYKPDAGEVRLGGRRITGVLPHEICHLGLGRTFQITRLFWRLGVLENMIVAVKKPGLRALVGPGVLREDEERALALLERIGLAHLRRSPARDLSFGQQKLLEFAAVMMSDPDLVLLDEPAGGVNPTMMEFMTDWIRELNLEGVTFLVVEHNMGVVMDLCERVLVLDQGRKICDGPPEHVQTDPGVLDAYLGV